MKWRTPTEGDTREVTRFAWLPIALDNGETIWLESYLSREWRKRFISGASDAEVLQWFIRERLPRRGVE